MIHDQSDTPGVIAPPPLIFFGGLAISLLVNWFVPLPLVPAPFNWMIGLILIALGLWLGASAFRAMRRAGTPVDPYESPTALVAEGPFRVSRNPIYLGFTLIYLGFACTFNALWAILFLPISLALIHFGVIVREERYLERKFGETYSRYKASVRRWL